MGCRQRCTPQKTLGRRPERRADCHSTRAQPQRGVRQVAAYGPKARSQAAHRQTQDRVGTEAKASAVGGLCARPVHKIVSTRKPVVRRPKELTKSQLIAMLAEAAANTARLLR